MQGNNLRNIFFVGISLLIVGLVAGYLAWNKPHRNVKDAPAVETDAVSLYSAFITDSVKAQTDFVNKIAMVSGIVRDVTYNQQRQQIVLLMTSVPGASVNCTMEAADNKIKKGSKVKIKGICSGYINGDAEMGIPGDVILIRCYTSN